MKKHQLWILIFPMLIVSACSSSKKTTDPKASGVWINEEKRQGKTFHKIFFVVLTADVEARVQLENALAAAAIAKGYEAVKSIDVMPPNIKDPKTPTREEVVSKVKTSGADAVFVGSVLKKEEAIKYNEAQTAYAERPSWGGTYYGYYNHWYPTVSTSSYYDNDKTYLMQSNLFDVATEEIMFSVLSKVFNPSSLKDFSKEYTTTLMKQLEKGGLLRK